MKNSMLDLNNHLFEALERLNDKDLIGIALEEEIAKSKAMLSVAGGIIETGRLVIDAQRILGDNDKKEIPKLLTFEKHQF